MRSLPARCGAEGIGTFFLVFIGVGAIVVDRRLGHVGISLAFVVCAMVYAGGYISGAHLDV